VGIDRKYLGSSKPFFTTKEVGRARVPDQDGSAAIKQHDGSILVKSKPGNGTTFSIYLPVMEDDSTVRKNNQRP
jgi:signal transduction histidine kinase